MKLLELPGETAIGGADLQADDLLQRSRSAAEQARALVLAVLRGEIDSLPTQERHDPAGD